jgi:hypothetical protein
VRPTWCRVGRQRAQKGKQVADVVERHALIGGIGKSRIEVFAVASDAAQHGIDEGFFRPGADAMRRIGRQVGRIKASKRGVECEPAAEPSGVLLLGSGVTGGATPGVEHGLAVGGVGGARGQRAGYGRLRHGEHIEQAGAGNQQKRQRHDDPA